MSSNGMEACDTSATAASREIAPGEAEAPQNTHDEAASVPTLVEVAVTVMAVALLTSGLVGAFVGTRPGEVIALLATGLLLAAFAAAVTAYRVRQDLVTRRTLPQVRHLRKELEPQIRHLRKELEPVLPELRNLARELRLQTRKETGSAETNEQPDRN